MSAVLSGKRVEAWTAITKDRSIDYNISLRSRAKSIHIARKAWSILGICDIAAIWRLMDTMVLTTMSIDVKPNDWPIILFIHMSVS